MFTSNALCCGTFLKLVGSPPSDEEKAKLEKEAKGGDESEDWSLWTMLKNYEKHEDRAGEQCFMGVLYNLVRFAYHFIFNVQTHGDGDGRFAEHLKACMYFIQIASRFGFVSLVKHLKNRAQKSNHVLKDKHFGELASYHMKSLHLDHLAHFDETWLCCAWLFDALGYEVSMDRAGKPVDMFCSPDYFLAIDIGKEEKDKFYPALDAILAKTAPQARHLLHWILLQR